MCCCPPSSSVLNVGLGPVPLTYYIIVGELKEGLSWCIYVRCMNSDCGAVNRAPYGNTQEEVTTGYAILCCEIQRWKLVTVANNCYF